MGQRMNEARRKLIRREAQKMARRRWSWDEEVNWTSGAHLGSAAHLATGRHYDHERTEDLR